MRIISTRRYLPDGTGVPRLCQGGLRPAEGGTGRLRLTPLAVPNRTASNTDVTGGGEGMRDARPNILPRAMTGLRPLPPRARDRVAGLPIRAQHRKQGLPIPPPHLIFLVANSENLPWFLDSGT